MQLQGLCANLLAEFRMRRLCEGKGFLVGFKAKVAVGDNLCKGPVQQQQGYSTGATGFRCVNWRACLLVCSCVCLFALMCARACLCVCVSSPNAPVLPAEAGIARGRGCDANVVGQVAQESDNQQRRDAAQRRLPVLFWGHATMTMMVVMCVRACVRVYVCVCACVCA